jgi:hypothetical protein
LCQAFASHQAFPFYQAFALHQASVLFTKAFLHTKPVVHSKLVLLTQHSLHTALPKNHETPREPQIYAKDQAFAFPTIETMTAFVAQQDLLSITLMPRIPYPPCIPFTPKHCLQY